MTAIHPKWEPLPQPGGVSEVLPHCVAILGDNRMAQLQRSFWAHDWCEIHGLVRFGTYTHVDGSKHYNRDASFSQIGFEYRFLNADVALRCLMHLAHMCSTS